MKYRIALVGLLSLNISIIAMDPYKTPERVVQESLQPAQPVQGEQSQKNLKTPSDDAYLNASLFSSVDTSDPPSTAKSNAAYSPPALPFSQAEKPLDETLNSPEQNSGSTKNPSLAAVVAAAQNNAASQLTNGQVAPPPLPEPLNSLEKNLEPNQNTSIVATLAVDAKIQEQHETSPLLPNGNTHSINGKAYTTKYEEFKPRKQIKDLEQESKKCCNLL